jgi:hypothetical protein
MSRSATTSGSLIGCHETAFLTFGGVPVEVLYLPFGREQANLFFQVVARRYERGSLILTSKLAFGSGDEGRATLCSPPPCSIESCITPPSFQSLERATALRTSAGPAL